MNPHPLGYHQILAQIALEHPNGGADLQAEVARRFMGTGDVVAPPATLPVRQQSQVPQEVDAGATIQAQNDAQAAQDQIPEQDKINSALDKAVADNGLGGQTATAGNGIPLVPTGDKQQPPPAKTAPRGTGGGQPAESADDRDWNAATGDKIQSLEDQTDVASQRSAQEGSEQRDIANQQQAMLNKSNAFNDDIQQTELRLGQKQEDLINQYANATVDPHRYWNSLDTGHQILAGISLFLGGGGDASPVVSAINRDVQLQAQQIERTGKAAGMVGELIDHYRGMGLDNRQSTGLAVTTASEIGKQRALATAEQFAGPEGRARLGSAIADVTQNGAVGRMNLHNVASQVAEHRASAYNQSVQAQTGAYNLGQAKKYGTILENAGVPAGAPVGSTFIDQASGSTGFSYNGEGGVKQFQADVAPAQQALQHIQNIKAIRDGGEANIAKNQASLASEAAGLKSAFLAMNKVPEGQKSQQIADSAVGDPTELVPRPGGGYDQKQAQIVRDANQLIARSAAQNRIVFKSNPAEAARGLRRPVLPSIRKKNG